MPTVDPEPKCGICGYPMVLLKEETANKKLPVYVCSKGKEGFRMPCDGFAWDIALKNM